MYHFWIQKFKMSEHAVGTDWDLYACSNYGLTFSTNKTELLHQADGGEKQTNQPITVNGQKLKLVERFTYLVITLSKNCPIWW